ncbi:peptidase inhibitor family I36 protein [Streptomyces virginiae]|uniref:peptidase inhibitor family I36 protein n=1 Tax=Streptomyces virginiae TaxID=1961 RepID=UPI00224CC6A4|nr:peptidase inhibitor family I36 protein [Streptomyces virginiae]MCX4957863.1 peptidase inhibitor family I36 protein [Streptomyces virginiae]
MQRLPRELRHLLLQLQPDRLPDQLHRHERLGGRDIAGYGQPVKNNAASFYNGSMQKATVFYNSGFAGACDAVASLTNVYKLNKTYNQNASLGFGSRTGSNCYMFN